MINTSIRWLRSADNKCKTPAEGGCRVARGEFLENAAKIILWVAADGFPGTPARNAYSTFAKVHELRELRITYIGNRRAF